jgi:hypothetical protein
LLDPLFVLSVRSVLFTKVSHPWFGLFADSITTRKAGWKNDHKLFTGCLEDGF